MSDKNCSIVKDLLPLYIDGVVSDEAKEFIENHIANCEECARELDLLKKDLTPTDVVDKNMEKTMPILKIKKQIRKRQLITAVISALVMLAVSLCGFKLYLMKSRPDINGNVKIVSKELTNDGLPKNVLFESGNGFEVSKDMGEVFLSLPVNNKKMDKCKVTLTYNGQEIEHKTISVSEKGYVTYAFEDLPGRESGLYLFAFYDADNEINQYISIIVTP